MNAVRSFKVLFLLLLLGVSSSIAQTLPPGTYTLSSDSLMIHSDGFSDTYIFGLGWVSGSDLPAPLIAGGAVTVAPEIFSRTGAPAAAPAPAMTFPARIDGLRFGGSEVIRVVLDLPSLASAAGLERYTGGGRVEDGHLRLDLDGLIPPSGSFAPYQGVRAAFRDQGLDLSLPAGTWAWNAFVLSGPVRLVIDLTPVALAAPAPAAPVTPVPAASLDAGEGRRLAAGVTYREFSYPTARGSSRVHLIDVAPGAGQFRVVGSSREPATLSQLARGSIAAINAGYFNTTTHEAIGLLLVDGQLDALPTLGRASIGFGSGTTLIDRVSASVSLRLAGGTITVPLGADGATLVDQAGVRAGSVTQGVITIRGSTVLSNRVGPVTVPQGSYAVVYSPEIRELALLDPGDVLTSSISFDPAFFNSAMHAVEAGPLLVMNGASAFQPELEQFARGQRILDDYTTQSAIGVRPDGSVLLVVADSMRAEDLVPLFISLGASQAMRLDSGGSAALYGNGQVINRNIERRIVSAIVLVPHQGALQSR